MVRKWIKFESYDRNTKFDTLHIDTRDFGILPVSFGTDSEEMGDKEFYNESIKDIETLRKYGKKFFFTKEELFNVLDSFYKKSGGNKSWRFFELKGNNKFSGWSLKYLRIVNVNDEYIIRSNRTGYALSKEDVELPINEEILSAH